MIKLVVLILVVVFFLAGLGIFLLGFPMLQEGASSANTSATVDVGNYPGWAATADSAPWLALAAVMGIGGYAVFRVLKP